MTLSTIQLPWWEDIQVRDLVPFFGDLGQSEKLTEIKPPLNTGNEKNVRTFYGTN